MKKTLAILLVMCLAFTMIPFGAFALNTASISVSFVDAQGNPVSTVKPGASVWASVKLSGYDNLVGEADADSIDRAIAEVVTYLDLSAGLTPAVENDAVVWATKLDSLYTNNGVMSHYVDGTVLRLELATDNAAGATYAIDNADLTNVGGEIFRIKLNVDDSADGKLTATLVKGSGEVEAGIALVSKANADDKPEASELALSGFGTSASVTAAKVAEPDSYTLYRHILVEDFKRDEWKNESGSFNFIEKAGEITNAFVLSGDGKPSQGVYSVGQYDLTGGFHAEWVSYRAWYNSWDEDPYSHAGIYVGDLFVKFDTHNRKVTVTKGKEIVATAGFTQENAKNTVDKYPYAKRFMDTYPTKEAHTGGLSEVDYVNGVLTVKFNGTEIISEIVELDNLSNAEVKFSALAGYQELCVYDFVLAQVKTVNLFELNTQMGTLAGVTDYSAYSDIAAVADDVLPQISDELIALMNNISVYEKYKSEYELAQCTYTAVDGLRQSDWASHEFKTGNESTPDIYVRNEANPSGIISIKENQTAKITFKNGLLVDDNYFEAGVRIVGGGYYYNQEYTNNYVEYSVGALKIKLLNYKTADDKKNLKLVVTLNNTEIYTKEYADFSGIHGGDFVYKFVYDNGTLTVTRTDTSNKVTAIDTVYLTKLDGWDTDYTPNGTVGLDISRDKHTPNNLTKISGVYVKGRMSQAAVEAIDAMATTNPGMARRIFDSLDDIAKARLADATVTALSGEFTDPIEADNNVIVESAETNPYEPIFGEELTYTAKPKEGYKFIGWYNGNTVYSFDEEITVVKQPNLALRAMVKYNKATVTITGTNVTVNGNYSGNVYTNDLKLGTPVTVTTGANDFAYWMNDDNKIISENSTYTFTVVGETTLTAVCKDHPVEGTKRIMFISDYGQIMHSRMYTRNMIGENAAADGALKSLPMVPSKTNYAPGEWSMTLDEIARAFDDESTGDVITVTPVYPEITESATVTVVGGTISGTNTDTQSFTINTVVEITANTPDDGQKFAYWTDESGTIVGYNDKYTFSISKDTKIIAVFVASEESVEAVGTAQIVDIVKRKEKNGISFVAMLTVPKGAKIDHAGIVATSDSAKAGNLTAENADYVRGKANDKTTVEYTWTKSKAGDATWYVRAYLVYTMNGTQYTVYGDVVTAVYSEL